jgi:hypothetical protein
MIYSKYRPWTGEEGGMPGFEPRTIISFCALPSVGPNFKLLFESDIQ